MLWYRLPEYISQVLYKFNASKLQKTALKTISKETAAENLRTQEVSRQ